MSILKIRSKKLPVVNWGSNSLDFIRGSQQTKTTNVNYTNGEGQTLTSNQTLYESGTYNTPSYVKISTVNSYTLNGSGIIDLQVIHYPSDTEVDYVIPINLFNGTMNISLVYNSLPVGQDIFIELQNRAAHIFTMEDFVVSDYDGDEITEIQINGDVTNFTIDGVSYVSGQWISVTTISNGLLKYTSPDTNDQVDVDLIWKAKDVRGNISL